MREKSATAAARGLLTIALTVVFAFSVLNYVLPRFDPLFDTTSWRVVSSLEGFTARTSGYASEGQALRWEQVRLASSITESKLWGSGIGSLNYSALVGLRGESFAEYRHALGWATGLTTNYLETGAIGVGLFVLAILSFSLKGVAIARGSTDPFWKVFGLGFVGAAVIFAVSSFLSDTWRAEATACSFWICVAVVERTNLRLKNTVPNDPPS